MSDYTAQDELQRFVVAKVMRLYHQKSNGVSAATAQLAQLRRGVGASPFQYPELLGIILEKEDGTEGIPEQYRGRGEQPSNAESAAYTALTLFSSASAVAEPAHARCRGFFWQRGRQAGWRHHNVNEEAF